MKGRSVTAAGAAVLVLALGACAEPAPPTGTPTTTSSADSSQPLGASTSGQAPAPVLTVDEVLRALNRAGLPAPNPVDTTAQECGAAQCEQSVVTDTLRVKSFASPAQAAQYAVPRRIKHVGTVTVSFPPHLPPAEQQRYWSVISALVR
ncbi:hypothetical protein [Mycolicibacterium elephantis]|nr:hypothetical protein [Mycolicibacterium elephantis]MCV7221851.1 hypothetical protein [Mycolicibacterium elephantis]